MTNEEEFLVDRCLADKILRIQNHITDTIKQNGDISQFKEDVLYVIHFLLERQLKPEQLTATEICARNMDYNIYKEQRKQDEKYIRELRCEIEKQDNRIKELESDKEIKDKMIDDMVNWIYELFKARPGTVSKAFNYEVCISDDCDNINREVNCDYCIKQYFENLAKESGEIDENNRIIE